MKRLAIIFIFLLLLSLDLSAQQKGMKIVGKASLEMSDVVYQTGWAIIIGINKYPHVTQLSYAVNDADSIAKIIKDKFGFDERNIKILKDSQATRQGIISALNSLTDSRKIKENDCALVYFSGHGQTVPLPKSGGGGDLGYLVPYDAQIDLSQESNIAEYNQYCIGMDELNKIGRMIPAKHVIFIIDSCYSGLVIESERGLDPKIQEYIKKVASVPVRQIITAGGKEDKALEDPSLGHGLLTYKLLQGLESGIADTNSDGVITGSELGNYLRGVVPQENSKQFPQFRMRGEGEFMFLPQEDTKPTPTAPSNSKFSLDDLKGEADRQEALEKAKQAWASKLTEMKSAFSEVKAYESRDVTQSNRVTAWQRFIDTFKEDNPYSQEDDTMRQSARKQLEYWKNQPSETIPEANRIDPSVKTIIGKDGAEMVLISAGEFQMGDNYFGNAKVHTVYLDAFYIDKYEVTNAQYKKFMDATGHKAPKYWNDANYNKPNHLVVGVDWNDASAYCSWAGKRLPTEAEWEKSARGGLVGKKYVWGDEWPPPSKAGNFDDETTVDSLRISGYSDGYVWTSPVGSFKPNGYGLYDMAGNVWEWVADWYDRNYYSSSPKSNPTGPSSGSSRVLRGGSWDDADDYDLRVAYRDLYVPTSNGSHVGFRGAGLVR